FDDSAHDNIVDFIHARSGPPIRNDPQAPNGDGNLVSGADITTGCGGGGSIPCLNNASRTSGPLATWAPGGVQSLGAGAGLTVKSPNGQTCAIIGIDDDGALAAPKPIACPCVSTNDCVPPPGFPPPATSVCCCKP